nr:hypothetical protein [Tanacetum cinerariifolium]
LKFLTLRSYVASTAFNLLSTASGREPAEREVKLLTLTEGRTVLLNPPVLAASRDSDDSIDKLFDEGNDDVPKETIAKDVSKVATEKTKKKRKRKVAGDASGSTFPPKRLREDHHATTSNTEGEISCWDVPAMTVVITTTVTANASAIPPPEVRVVSKNLEIFRDSAFAGGANANAAGTSKFNEPADSSDSFYASQDLDSKTLHRIYVSKWNVTNDFVLDDPYEQKDKLEDKCSEQTALLSERDAEIAHLKSLLSLKEAEAAGAIRLRGQISAIEAVDAAKAALKETELAFLTAQVAQLTFDLSGFQLSRNELSFKVASLESERDCLKSSLESEFEFFRERVEATQDEQAKAIDCAVNKGIQDDLRAGIDHGKAGKDLSVIEAYDPFAEAKYVEFVSALCCSLSSSKGKEREIMEKHLSLTDVMVPLAEPLSSRSLIGEASTSAAPATSEPITTLSTTFASFDVVPPLSISNDQFLHDEDPRVITFEKKS